MGSSAALAPAVWGSKLAAALLFALIGAMGAAIPAFLNKCKCIRAVGFLSSFAGGAFLSLGVLHILPDAVESLASAEFSLHVNGRPYNAAYLLAFAGYLIILFCEAVLPGNDGLEHSPSGGAIDVCELRERNSRLKKSRQAKAHCELVPCGAPGEEGEAAFCAEAEKKPSSSRGSSSTSSRDGEVEGGIVMRDCEDPDPLRTASAFVEKPPVDCRSFDSGAFFMMLALSIHGLFEGVIVGSADDLASVWMTSAVIIGHKWMEALMLVCRISERNLTRATALSLLGAFIFSSPIGVVVGAVAASEGGITSGICNSIGAGTVLYVAAEIAVSVFAGSRLQRLRQFCLYCCGAALVLGLTLLDVAFEA